MKDRGFACRDGLASSQTTGMAQRRTRGFLLGVRGESLGISREEAQGLADRWEQCLRSQEEARREAG